MNPEKQQRPGKGGLPHPWGRLLPILMLAAAVVAVALLIATSNDKPDHQVPIGPAPQQGYPTR